MNSALRDPSVRAIFAAMGGKGLYPTMPLGTQATLDTAAGTLSVEPAVY